MKSGMGANRAQKMKYLHRILAMLLCLIMVFSVCETAIVSLAQALDSLELPQKETREETREEIKKRLMRQIRYEGWDPYSEDMTLDEFYALMELFDEGKLPLKETSSLWNSILSVLGLSDEPSAAAGETHIPRTKFLYAGLDSYKHHEGDADEPLPYDNTNEAEDDEPGAYPPNLDPFGANYKRPPVTWNGIALTDPNTNRVVIVSEGINDDDMSVAGDVNQKLFAQYTGYYVKQVTIDGANVNVLGMIKLVEDGEERFVYYYLSAEDQNTQVSTTTLPDEAKLIIEYVPEEHKIDYVVILDGKDVTEYVPEEDVVIFGSNSPTEDSWVNSIFGVSHAHKTTDGAYSFDVFVPYGYQLQILISIDMEVQVPYASPTTENKFHVEIDHTGKKEDVKESWLNAYAAYLQEQGFVTDRNDFNSKITETEDAKTGNITLEWNVADDPDKDAHNSILSRMAERINDFVLHNNGYPLGVYPDYSIQGPGGFRLLADTANGPTEHTMNDTFYNHLVKADRIVTAVLKKQDPLTFDVSQILKLSDGAKNRGSSATKEFAFDSLEYYDEDYEYHVENGATQNRDGDPLTHGSTYPNIQSEGDAWGWERETNSFRKKAQDMKYDAETGTYSYTWFFQTNDGEGGYYLDAFEVNGIPVTIPFYPKYNWDTSYVFQGEKEIADEKHPYYTETTLADGSILRLEFLLGWNNSKGIPQRHYRVTVTGARSNVVVTGFNLMTGNGAREFVTYNLVGVYSDDGGYSQTAPAIEYYARTGVWTRKAQANVIVDSNNLGIDYSGGDTDNYGANIRFKITEGYGNPYYSWTNRHGDVINDQASVTFDEDGNITFTNDILSFDDVVNGTLSSQYIYDGGDGYYYIRVTNQMNNNTGVDYRFALLNVVARTIKYTVRYTQEAGEGKDAWYGFVMDDNGDLVQLTQEWMADGRSELDVYNMPSFEHNPAICALWEMAVDSEFGDVLPEWQAVLHQYDDNDGPFYDLIFNNLATIATDAYGTIRPKDTNNRYIFQNWILVGDDFMPVRDEENNVIQFLGGAIDVVQYADYSVKHVAFGNASTDIHVFRLMPVWKYIKKPLVYSVVLNWVDNLGHIYAQEFHDNWDDVVTEMTVDGQVFVYINKDARPLLDWIANHPTYTFWDDVNNAVDDGTEKAKDKIEKALKDYLERGGSNDNYDNILKALMQEDFIGADGKKIEGNDTFKRHGSDIFIVENGGRICVWMYENKGGLVFSKDVQGEPFTPDDEFYFTIADAKVKKVNGVDYTEPLSGVYKAYPQFVYDEDGKPRERTDADAWLVEFENGKIKRINGDEKVTYFTLKSGEGIELYISAGQYTIAELGSKSGGVYKVNVTYAAANGSAQPDGSWNIPTDENLWLNGSKKEYYAAAPDGVQQVSATVNFEVGEQNVVQTLTFTNATLSLRINCKVLAPDGNALWTHKFGYRLEFTLPGNGTPLKDADGSYYYNLTIYRKKAGGAGYTTEVIKLSMEQVPAEPMLRRASAGENVWSSRTTFELRHDDYAVIILPATSDPNEKIGYKASENNPSGGEGWYLVGEGYERIGALALGNHGEETYINTTNSPSIYITKRVVRSDGVKDTNVFKFTVTLSDSSYSVGEFTNGVATFTLKDGESKYLVLQDISTGVTYTVTEERYDGYITTATNTTGTIVDGTMILVEFTNTRIESNGYLVITETGGQPNESFLYRITNTQTGQSIIVCVKGGGATYVYAPLGKYTIEEISDWSWKYEDGVCVNPNTGKNSCTVEITTDNALQKDAVHADFEHKRNEKVWLGGESSENNLFSGAASNAEQGSNSGQTEYALLNVNADKKKKMI